MIYQAMNVYFDPIGLGVLISPGVGRDTRNVEAKVLVQKNFFNDRLRAVMNFGGDIGTERSDAAWSDVSALPSTRGSPITSPGHGPRRSSSTPSMTLTACC